MCRRWRRGVNGVVVEMLVVEMFVVVGRRLRMGVRRCLRGRVVEVKVVAVWRSCSGALLSVATWLLGGGGGIGPK